jgi:hypothetical protein
MPSSTLDRLLDKLDEAKRPAGAASISGVRKLLGQFKRLHFRDASQLVRFHEILLFMRAYPQSPALLTQTKGLLASFRKRVAELEEAAGADLTPFTEPEASGIDGTTFSTTYSYDICRHLVQKHSSQVEIDWDGYDQQERFALLMSRFLPLLEEDSYVETYYPFLDWLHAAKAGGETDLSWLVRCFERLQISEKERAELFDSLKLWVRWQVSRSPAARTLTTCPVRELFYHTGPLLKRSEISLAHELDAPPLPVVKLAREEGAKLLDLGRSTMAVRYRELHGYTYGDSARVWKADAGRGVELFLWGVPHARRLPTLAYHAALILKNGVPHGYAEALSLFERTEVGLNLFYTFRDGESAWIYARLLRLLRQLLGVTVFSVDPYQLGHDNEEGIASGAFWFYRKLGFRPIRPALIRTTETEERKITSRDGYRTSTRILRQLVSGHVLFETQDTPRGDWDRFHIRNLGLAVQRRMASSAGGDAQRLRKASEAVVARALGVRTEKWKEPERAAFGNLSLILSLIPGLSRWSRNEKSGVVSIVRAKAGADEARYLRLLQEHPGLREEIIRLGSAEG